MAYAETFVAQAGLSELGEVVGEDFGIMALQLLAGLGVAGLIAMAFIGNSLGKK